jgi:hypothetical protein
LETVYTKADYLIKRSILLLFLFFGLNIHAQVDEDVQDSTATGYNQGKVELKNPTSILESYTYDPVTDRYVYTNSVDGFNINYPIILTPAEYHELALRESMREYFKKKSDAIDGKKEGSEEAKKDLLPRYYVNSGFFETLFGGNTIDVKPTGSVEMDLGVRYTKQDNPVIFAAKQVKHDLRFRPADQHEPDGKGRNASFGECQLRYRIDVCVPEPDQA